VEQDSSLNKQTPRALRQHDLLCLTGVFFLLSALGCSDDAPVVNTTDISYPSGTDATFYIPFVEDIGSLPKDVVSDTLSDTEVDAQEVDAQEVDTLVEDILLEDVLIDDIEWMEDTEDSWIAPDMGETATCEDGSLCDDGNPCTEDLCTPPGNCEYLPMENTCEDGNDCTENDDCIEGECLGDWLSCDDGNPCTNEACVPGTGCIYQNTDGYCGADSQWICVDGECVNSDE
jgi:hypothetical protein